MEDNRCTLGNVFLAAKVGVVYSTADVRVATSRRPEPAAMIAASCRAETRMILHCNGGKCEMREGDYAESRPVRIMGRCS